VLERKVAVKILRDDLGLPPESRSEHHRRMRHEAKAAAAIAHPNIVTLHDMGEDATHGVYLVFEYVEGVTLRERLTQGPLPIAEVPRLARALGSALAYAHAAGVIHRDIKPENVLLAKLGPKIADFGIARVFDSPLPRAGAVLGTPSYSAPEALAHGRFGPASDQFSLAATLYEAICGQRAFLGSDALAIADKIASEPPPALEGVDLEPRIVGRLNAALRRGMAKDPADRHASCEDLGEAVAAAIEAPAEGSVSIARTERESVRAQALLGAEREGIPWEVSGPISTRPSVMIRRRTHRLQNIFAGVALLTIIALVVIGRKNRDDADAKTNPSASATSSVHRVAPPPSGKHENHGSATSGSARHASQSDASTADADSE
jgi:serine/threonine-protein kinase